MSNIDNTKKDYIYQLSKKAALAALNKKANNVILLDLRELTSMTDFFIICSGDVTEHVKAISKGIRKELSSEIKPWHIEGSGHLSWVLLDYIDFVVHVFDNKTREYYNLEKLWTGAHRETFDSPE